MTWNTNINNFSMHILDIVFNLSIISICIYHYTGRRLDNIMGAMLLLAISNVFLQIYFIDYLFAFFIINVGTKLSIKFL